MSEQFRSELAATPQPKPVPDGYRSWNDYWTKVHKQPWRTEPEIDKERQEYLVQRRAVQPDIRKGIYPFRDETGNIKLTRADVEWLLAEHESGGIRGPVDRSDQKQRVRQGLDLRGADLQDANLRNLPMAAIQGGLNQAEGKSTTRKTRRFASTHFEGADLTAALLEGANLARAYLQNADLSGAHLEQAQLFATHLEGANFNQAFLGGANIRSAFFDSAVYLHRTSVNHAKYGGVLVADARWNAVNLATVQWEHLKLLGDEQEARKRRTLGGQKKQASLRLTEYQGAVRANRQLSVVLKEQGLDEYANRYAYRAQLCQRVVLSREHKYLRYFGSLLLDLMSGYGYRPMRSVLTYAIVVLGFAAAYFALTNFDITPFLPAHSSPLPWYEAIVLSISSFHGRGLFPTGLSLGDPIAILAAGEAIIGLLIEITFIATFTQRFFAR